MQIKELFSETRDRNKNIVRIQLYIFMIYWSGNLPLPENDKGTNFTSWHYLFAYISIPDIVLVFTLRAAHKGGMALAPRDLFLRLSERSCRLLSTCFCGGTCHFWHSLMYTVLPIFTSEAGMISGRYRDTCTYFLVEPVHVSRTLTNAYILNIQD